MNIVMECKKMRRTGFYPAFIAGGILASCLPVMNMAVRPETFIDLHQPSLTILLDTNWTMMAMLNILLIVSAACIMYHTEYDGNAIQKMQALPLRESGIFFAKFVLMTCMSIVTLAIEALALLFCSLRWFEKYENLYPDLLKNFGYFLILMLPAVLLSLAIASACNNMWISLGVGVICVFTASMIVSTDHFILQIFPFALPFRILAGAASLTVKKFLITIISEVSVIGLAELTFLRIRRALL